MKIYKMSNGRIKVVSAQKLPTMKNCRYVGRTIKPPFEYFYEFAGYKTTIEVAEVLFGAPEAKPKAEPVVEKVPDTSFFDVYETSLPEEELSGSPDSDVVVETEKVVDVESCPWDEDDEDVVVSSEPVLYSQEPQEVVEPAPKKRGRPKKVKGDTEAATNKNRRPSK